MEEERLKGRRRRRRRRVDEGEAEEQRRILAERLIRWLLGDLQAA
jgi:hypothetical protein